VSQNTPTGFFAYPSNPPLIGETIRTAVEIINNGGFGNVITWENLIVGGKDMIQEIIRAIDNAQFFCVDLTGLNLNVMFEFGYAIARNKPIFPILDNSFPANNNLFDQLRMLTTIAYTPYQNHRQIVDGFYREQPYRTGAQTLFEQLIQTSLQTVTEEKLLY